MIFYLEFIYTSCTSYSLYYFSGVWPSQQATLGDLSTIPYAVLGDCSDHRACLRSQPRSGTCRLVSMLCSKTANHQTRLRSQPRLETCPPVPTPCSRTVPTTEHVYFPNHARGLVDQSLYRARGFINHSMRCARDLLRLLSNHSLGIAFLSYI